MFKSNMRVVGLHVGQYKKGNLHGRQTAMYERIIDLQTTIELLNKTIGQELLPQSDAPSCTVLVRCVPEGGCDWV